MLQKAEGIVIRTFPYGEAHLVITLLTRERGKIAVMARGARRGKSKLRAVSQLFTQGIFLFYGGQGMPSLNQGEVLHLFRLQSDIRQTAYASYLCELVVRLLEEWEPHPQLYELLLTMLNHIEQGKDPEVISRIFEMQLLMAIGLKPELSHCIRCQSEEAPFRFSVKEGGVLCQSCGKGDPYALTLSEATRKLLYLFQLIPPERVGEIDVKATTRRQMEQVMWQFIDDHTGVSFKSRSFIQQLDRYGL